MLSGLISPEDCASCRVCCFFHDYSVWEAPVITHDCAARIKGRGIDASYNELADGARFAMQPDEEGLYFCPMLSDKGCLLGHDKPLECAMWPFRVMRLGDLLVLGLSPVCGAVAKLPLSRITGFVEGGFSDKAFAIAADNPAEIKDYVPGYIILAINGKSSQSS